MSEETPRDRSTLFIVGLVVASILVYAGLLAIAKEYSTAHQPGSSYDSSAVGLKVWFLYLEDLGYDPKTLERFDALPEDATIVVSAPLLKAPNSSDRRVLADWVNAGGRLVAVGDVAQLAESVSIVGTSTGGASRPMEPVLPSAYAWGIDAIDLDGQRLHEADTAWVVHYKDTAGQGLLSRAVGAGEVVWLAGTHPVRNDGIGQEDNARLAVALAVGDGRDIYFDEYHKGYISGGGVWERLGHGGRAALVLGVLGLVLLALGPGRRLGAPIADPVLAEARTGAYTSSLAELYRAAGAKREALETLEDGLKRVITKRHGALLIGMDRHPDARVALEHSARVRAAADIELTAFLGAAEQLGRARREVEGRDV